MKFRICVSHYALVGALRMDQQQQNEANKAFFNSVKAGNTRKADEYLRAGADIESCVTWSGCGGGPRNDNAMSYVCKFWDSSDLSWFLRRLRFLPERGAKVTVQNIMDLMVEGVACKTHSWREFHREAEEAVKLLIERCDNLDSVGYYEYGEMSFGWHPDVRVSLLTLAAVFRLVSLVKFLLRSGSAVDSTAINFLHFDQTDQLKSSRKLPKYDNYTQEDDIETMTVLHRTSDLKGIIGKQDSALQVKECLKSGAVPFARNLHGNNALMSAVASNDISAVKHILSSVAGNLISKCLLICVRLVRKHHLPNDVLRRIIRSVAGCDQIKRRIDCPDDPTPSEEDMYLGTHEVAELRDLMTMKNNAGQNVFDILNEGVSDEMRAFFKSDVMEPILSALKPSDVAPVESGN